MKSMVKRILSVFLILCLCLPLLPQVDMPVEAASTGLTLSQLREKFPHGKYWNHAGNPGSSNSVNNQNGYTSTPCSQHGVVGTSKQTCNGFQPSGTQLSWQCMGYAEKLGYDATGYNPRNNANGWYTYTSSSALDNLKPGDIVRYKNNGHSIYVTGVNGDIVTYTDCNSDEHCIIRWDVTISKSTLRSSFTHVRSAPSSVLSGSTSCSCSASYAGTYICTTSSLNLTIRSGHGSSYSAIGTIPPGAIVTVSKASGMSSSDWAHVTYDGVTGYASMQYLSKKNTTQQRNSKIGIWFSKSEMGGSIGTIRTGEWLYLCYKLYDVNTGDLLDAYNTSGEYTAKLTLYETNGAVAHTHTYTNDNNWIAIKRATPGNYKGEIVFTWNSGGTATSTVTINMFYEPRVTPSASDIQLNVTGTNSQTINISYSGATSSNSIYLDCRTKGDCFSCKWGSWHDHKMPLTISGIRAGQGTITIELHDSDTDQIIATSKVYVTVTAPTYTVSYNANGGIGAPRSQTKYYNTVLTLSNTKPTRDGYSFLGWSTSFLATSATYQSGGSFTSNANTTLYAVWKANTYTVTYSANGGTDAPSSQTKTHDLSLTLTTKQPTRIGYTFLGWSTSSTATNATYQAGSSFFANGNTTLYAVWQKGCQDERHNYFYKEKRAATKDTTGILVGKCCLCEFEIFIELPILNTNDYIYTVIEKQSCIKNGVGLYRYKKYDYGTWDFVEIIPRYEHSIKYVPGVPATTENEGTQAHYECSVCKKLFKDEDCTTETTLDELKIDKVPVEAGWVLDGTGWWYRNNSEKGYATGWEIIDGAWYYFNEGGYMVTGWLNLGGTWYYMSGSGAMVTDWQIIGGSWYYFYADGSMAANAWIGNYYLTASGAMATPSWQLDGNGWWYSYGDGTYATGWAVINGSWYYFNASGYMVTGWLNLGGTWYYMSDSGAMVTDWQLIGGSWYYFYADGSMAANCYVGNYWLSPSGAMA